MNKGVSSGVTQLPRKQPALLPPLQPELQLCRALLACFFSDITTTQHIIRTVWTKPNALYKTTATLKHYVTGTAQAFKDSPERLTGHRRLCIIL